MKCLCYDKSKMSFIEGNNYLDFILTFKGFMDSAIVSRVDVNSIQKGIDFALETLTEREEKILRLRYGLSKENETRKMFLLEVGQIFNISAERVRQIEAKALRKLKHPSRSRLLAKMLKDPYSEYENQEDFLSESLNNIQPDFNGMLQQKLKKEVYAAIIDGDFTGSFVAAVMKKKNMLIVSSFNEHLLGCPLSDLKLSVRSHNCLVRAGITTAEELFNLTAEDLSNIRNLGAKQIQEINEKLKEFIVSEKDNEDEFKSVILKIGSDKVIYKSESLSGIADSIYKMYFSSNRKSKVIFEENISNMLKYYLLINGFLFSEDIKSELRTSQGLLINFEKIGLGKYAAELQSYFGESYLLCAISDELYNAIDDVNSLSLEELINMKEQQEEDSKLEIELRNITADIERFLGK